MTSLSKMCLVAIAGIMLSLGFSANAQPFDELTTSTDTTLSEFQKIYIAPVKLDLPETTRRRNRFTSREDRPVSGRDQSRKAQDLKNHMTAAFAKSFQIVDAPGPDVLTVEAVITRLISTRPTLEDLRIFPGIDFSSSLYAGGGNFDIALKSSDIILATLTEDYRTSLNDGRPRVATWQDFDRSSKSFSRKLVRYIKKN